MWQLGSWNVKGILQTWNLLSCSGIQHPKAVAMWLKKIPGSVAKKGYSVSISHSFVRIKVSAACQRCMTSWPDGSVTWNGRNYLFRKEPRQINWSVLTLSLMNAGAYIRRRQECMGQNSGQSKKHSSEDAHEKWYSEMLSSHFCRLDILVISQLVIPLSHYSCLAIKLTPSQTKRQEAPQNKQLSQGVETVFQTLREISHWCFHQGLL